MRVRIGRLLGVVKRFEGVVRVVRVAIVYIIEMKSVLDVFGGSDSEIDKSKT